MLRLVIQLFPLHVNILLSIPTEFTYFTIMRGIELQYFYYAMFTFPNLNIFSIFSLETVTYLVITTISFTYTYIILKPCRKYLSCYFER